MNLITSYKTELELLKKFIEEEEERKETEKVAKKLADIFTKGNKVLICGNGGSNCDAMHFIEEFTGRFRKELEEKEEPCQQFLYQIHLI